MSRPFSKTIGIMLLIAAQVAAASGRTPADSLRVLLRSARDTVRIDLYNQLSYEYRRSDSELSLAYADSAIEAAQKAEYVRGIGNGYTNKGNYYKSTGNNERARACYVWAYVQHERIGNSVGIASVLNALASLHFLQGNLSQALTLFIRSLNLSQEAGDRRGVAITLNNIGVINLEQKNYSKALEYYERAYHTFNELGDASSSADALLNIGNIYHTQGLFDESLKYYRHGLEAKTALGDERGRSSVFNSLGLISSEKGDHEQALRYFFQALAIDERLNDKQFITISCNSIAGEYYELQMYFAAKKYCERALELEKKQNDRIDMVNTYQLLYKIEDALGNYKTALEYYKLHSVYRDSLYSEEARQKLENIEAQYKAEKNENERLLNTLRQEEKVSMEDMISEGMSKNILIVSIVLGAFLLAVYIIFFVLRKNR